MCFYVCTRHRYTSVHVSNCFAIRANNPGVAELPNTLGPSWRLSPLGGAQSRDLRQIEFLPLAR